jgi:hypothetical protein
LPQLRQAAGNPDAEVRRRAEQIAATVEQNARGLVEQKLKDPRARGIHPGLIEDSALAGTFPTRLFFAVIFPRYPLARVAPASLRSNNVFMVNDDASVKILTDAKQLEEMFRELLPLIRSDEAARAAAQAWLRLSQEFRQDGFFSFSIPAGELKVSRDHNGRKAVGKAVVKPVRGDRGEIQATLVFDDAGRLARVTEVNTVRAGIRPICQATKLLDPDPIVRRMAEQDLLVMGRSARNYLNDQRARASAELRQAIDRMWQRILAYEP